MGTKQAATSVSAAGCRGDRGVVGVGVGVGDGDGDGDDDDLKVGCGSSVTAKGVGPTLCFIRRLWRLT